LGNFCPVFLGQAEKYKSGFSGVGTVEMGACIWHQSNQPCILKNAKAKHHYKKS
jgi:hypothetical protein